jgi:hypothetical protein
LWLVLLLILPLEVKAELKFHASFDTDFDTIVPEGITASTITGSIDSAVYQSGGGSCITSQTTSNAHINYQPIDNSIIPINEGCMSFWVRWDTGETNPFFAILMERDSAPYLGTIWFRVDPAGASDDILLQMGNVLGNNVIASRASQTWPLDSWNCVILDWKWNDASGETQITVNGEIAFVSDEGDAENRTYVERVSMNVARHSAWIDEFKVYNVSGQCECAARKLDFGVPFGSPFGGGFGP